MSVQVQKELQDAHVLLAWRPPSWILDVLLHRRRWGLSRWRLVQLPPLRDRAASDQGPGHHAVLTAAPNEQNGPTTHVPQCLLHLVRRLRARQALTDSDVALLTEQARGGEWQV